MPECIGIMYKQTTLDTQTHLIHMHKGVRINGATQHIDTHRMHLLHTHTHTHIYSHLYEAKKSATILNIIISKKWIVKKKERNFMYTIWRIKKSYIVYKL